LMYVRIRHFCINIRVWPIYNFLYMQNFFTNQLNGY
jgi:hypothetical protein